MKPIQLGQRRLQIAITVPQSKPTFHQQDLVLNSLQRSIAQWSEKLVAAQATAAKELQQLLRRAETAALLQRSEAVAALGQSGDTAATKE